MVKNGSFLTKNSDFLLKMGFFFPILCKLNYKYAIIFCSFFGCFNKNNV